MKQVAPLSKALVCGLLLCIGQPSVWALGGSSGGGGGDLLRLYVGDVPSTGRYPSEFRMNRLRNYIQHNLRSDLKLRLKKLQADFGETNLKSLSPQLRPALELLIGKYASMLSDIDQTPPYILVESSYLYCTDCPNKDQRVHARTYHYFAAPIWISVQDLGTIDIPWSQMKDALVELLLHEHMRHHNFRDESGAYARALAQYTSPKPLKLGCTFNRHAIQNSFSNLVPPQSAFLKQKSIALSELDIRETYDQNCPTSLLEMRGSFTRVAQGPFEGSTNSSECKEGLVIEEESLAHRRLKVKGFHLFQGINTGSFDLSFFNFPNILKVSTFVVGKISGDTAVGPFSLVREEWIRIANSAPPLLNRDWNENEWDFGAREIRVSKSGWAQSRLLTQDKEQICNYRKIRN